ncbi:MAG TPA: MBL fold metallo-hydrolase [Chloroflexota bacterium]|jgi:glyoxylase-like metal-dependent hydrolase (beta-lactamase superfamily II)
MQVTANVRAVQVPDTNPMHPQFTTIYLVGRDQVLTIDSGEDMERYRWMLKGYLAATEKAEIGMSAVTHYHRDHSSNLKWLRDEFGAELKVFEQGIPLLQDRLPETGVTAIHHGNEIGPSDDVRLQVIHSPGHSADSICFYLESEGVLFTGDTILGASSTTVNDLGDYLDSLASLRDLPNLQLMCPGHGPVISNPVQYIDDYIRGRNQRERQILELLGQNAELTTWEIMETIYADRDLVPRLLRAADRQVATHLRKLEKEGRVKVYAGKPRQKSADEVARNEEHEHERVEVIRLAEQYREEDRRRALAAQEFGQAAEWEQPPRYALAR